MNLRRVRGLLVTVLVIAVIVPILALPLVRADTPRPADAIVVIGGDHKPEWMQKALELYVAGYAPVVLLSAGVVVAEGSETIAEAEVMRRQAVALGLPQSALLIASVSQSTFQNAYCLEEIAAARGWRSVLLVTSLFQSARAGRIFEGVFGEGLGLRSQPAAGCALCWWFQADQARVVGYEYYNWGRLLFGVRVAAEARPNNDCAVNPLVVQRTYH
jgi:uncharacterized SAM-binding protein YcdF (DUF218 family)